MRNVFASHQKGSALLEKRTALMEQITCFKDKPLFQGGWHTGKATKIRKCCLPFKKEKENFVQLSVSLPLEKQRSFLKQNFENSRLKSTCGTQVKL